MNESDTSATYHGPPTRRRSVRPAGGGQLVQARDKGAVIVLDETWPDMNTIVGESREELKARGAFYTPPEISAFLAGWAIRHASDRVLEPSSGDGAFMAAAARRFHDLGEVDLRDRLFGIELHPDEAEKSARQAPTANVRVTSFFDVSAAEMPAMDAVIGNPPYIRYHGFTGSARDAGLARAAEMGVALTGLASSWAHFVVHSASFLRPNGRLALVLPAELLHTDYAEQIRDFLSKRFRSIVIVAFDRNVFPGAQVDAILLLASNDDEIGLRILRVQDLAALLDLGLDARAGAAPRPASRRWSATLDGEAERIYADLAASPAVVRLGLVASVDIGVVTGANDFFVMSAAEARQRKLPRTALTPIVSRPADLRGLVVRRHETSRLLNLRGASTPKNAALVAYLEQGEANGVSQRYKSRTRKPWYGVPLPRARPDAFLPYMNHLAPRLIVNGEGAWSTNLLHGVSLFAGHRDIRAIAASMLSSITCLSAEIEGRAYGGGVLKTETKEAERLLIPFLSDATEAALLDAFIDLDDQVRAGKIASASAVVDRILEVDHDRYDTACHVFRARRLGRKNK